MSKLLTVMNLAPSLTSPLNGNDNSYTSGERAERRALGLPPAEPAASGQLRAVPQLKPGILKKAICAPGVLNEAAEYGSAFSRGLRLELPGGVTQLLISGTASIGDSGETLYPGDFKAQLWRTYRNITELLRREGATWRDVVRTTCYIRDIERDYAEFNNVRNEFFRALGLDPFPASTAIQARICRSDLLVEIEALALFRGGGVE